MNSRGYHWAPFQTTRWATVVVVLCALAYLIYEIVGPVRPGAPQPDWSRPLDWLMFLSPIALMVILAASAFLVRFHILLHLTAFLAVCSIPTTLLQQSSELIFLIIPLSAWVLMYMHAMASRRERKQLLTNPPIPQASQQTDIQTDISCVYCSYLLRGLRPDGRCPECGKPIAGSLFDQPLALYRPQWFTRVWIGSAIFSFSILMRAVVDFLVENTRTFGWHPEIANYLYFASAVFITVGAWFATASEKAGHRHRGTGARIFLRVVAVMYALLTWFFFIDFVIQQLVQNRVLTSAWLINYPYLSSRYDTLETVVYVVVEWLLAFYLYLLATRMPSKGLSRHAMIAGFLALIFMGINIVMPLMYQYFIPSENELLLDGIRIFLKDTPELYLGIFLAVFSIQFPLFYRRAVNG